MPLIKIMSCRQKLMSVLFKQNTIALPFKDHLQRIRSNVIFYNSFHSGRKTGQSPVNKVRRRFGRNSAFGKDKFIDRLNMRTNFSNQSDLLNTFRAGLNRVRFGIKLCCLRQSEKSKFNAVVSKGNNSRSEIEKTQTRSNFPHSGSNNTQAVSESLQPRCNNTQTGCNNRPTGCNNTRTGSNKNIQYMIIHRRIPTIFKKDNTNQNAGLEKRRTNQGIGANIRRLLTI